MPSGIVGWDNAKVKRSIRRATAGKLALVALQVVTQARRNLTENGQNDTGNLWESLYVATPARHTPIPPSGKYPSSKTGRMVERTNAPVVHPKEGVIVGVAADYAIFPELENSYLYRALTQVAGREAEDAMKGLGVGLFAGDIEE